MGFKTEFPSLKEELQPRQGVHCLLYRKEDNPTLAIYGSVRAGTAFEPGDRLGIAELTSRLLIRGTGKLGSPKIANMLESVGATLSFRNAQDNIIIQARTTSTWTQRLLGIISPCLTEPSFNRRDVERERGCGGAEGSPARARPSLTQMPQRQTGRIWQVSERGVRQGQSPRCETKS